MKELKEIFAENLANLRTQAKMTQLELGNTISYSDKAISKWERAEAIPDAYVLLKLSELFSVSVDYLLSDHEGQLPPKVKRRRTNYASISALSIIYLHFSLLQLSHLLFLHRSRLSMPLP